MTFIWATRGRTWGFRFLRRASLSDPLEVYDSAFAVLGDERFGFARTSDSVALRFEDPLGRKDRSGRVIPHEFVVFAPLADDVHSVEDGLRVIWPLVADDFAAIWELSDPGEELAGS